MTSLFMKCVKVVQNYLCMYSVCPPVCHDADGQECVTLSPKPNFSSLSLIFVVVRLKHG